MAQSRLNYDQVAHCYDARYAVDRLEGVARELRRVSEGLRGWILEVGCGTGRWLEEFGDARSVIGVDRSEGMLARAHEKRPGASLAAARANELPFRPETFHFIYVVNAVHHFEDASGFVQDAARLLRPGGALALAGVHPRLVRRYFYEFFPALRERDLARYPSFGALTDAMLAAGLHRIELRRAHRFFAEFRGPEVWSDPFLVQGSNSALGLLSEEEYQEGRRRIAEEIAQSEAEGEVPVFRSELDTYVLTGFRPA